MIGLCRQFDLNLTSMPLAQRPAKNLKLLLKFWDRERDEVWVRLDLPIPDAAVLITAMLSEWELKHDDRQTRPRAE
jgi:hypothetical protein